MNTTVYVDRDELLVLLGRWKGKTDDAGCLERVLLQLAPKHHHQGVSDHTQLYNYVLLPQIHQNN